MDAAFGLLSSRSSDAKNPVSAAIACKTHGPLFRRYYPMFKKPLFLSAFLLLCAAGCGSSVCVGTNCACPANSTCAFDACSAGASGCNFDCAAGSTCTGSCGPSCNVSCVGKSCTHTVGAGSNVSCVGGTCNITCTGSCTVSGNMSLTCSGGTKIATGCS